LRASLYHLAWKPKRNDNMEIHSPPPPKKKKKRSESQLVQTDWRGVRRMHPSQCRIERKVKPESPWTSLLYPSRLSRSISREWRAGKSCPMSCSFTL
jgi:hypothetical protein